MRKSQKRWLKALAVLAGVGAAHQLGCASFAGDQFLSQVNFCFIFDCSDGALGGIINFCPTTNAVTGDSTEAIDVTSDNLFVDC